MFGNVPRPARPCFDLCRVAELVTESIVLLLFGIVNGWTQAQRVSKVQ